MTLLTFILALADHPGSMRMKEIDPHGWTLSIIAVSVVFSALVILFLIYSLSGGIFTGKFKRKDRPAKKTKGVPDDQTAAAIALALAQYGSSDAETAAIAAALHLYLSESIHDTEPGIITIRRDIPSDWGNKSFLFRTTIKRQ